MRSYFFVMERLVQNGPVCPISQLPQRLVQVIWRIPDYSGC